VKILVIDDDPQVQTLLRAVALSLKHDTVSAFDALQGPMLARREKPDLIVLDINMPGGTGYRVLKQLRGMAETFETPILVHTSVPRDQVDEKIRESPVTFVLSKPATPEQVKDKLNELLAFPG
jgi:CheY-like chemotaxis protein